MKSPHKQSKISCINSKLRLVKLGLQPTEDKPEQSKRGFVSDTPHRRKELLSATDEKTRGLENFGRAPYVV